MKDVNSQNISFFCPSSSFFANQPLVFVLSAFRVSHVYHLQKRWCCKTWYEWSFFRGSTYLIWAKPALRWLVVRCTTYTVCPRRIRTQPKICFYYKIHNFYPIVKKNFVKMRSSWVSHFKKVSLWLGKNCDFLLKVYFWLSPDSPGTHCRN